MKKAFTVLFLTLCCNLALQAEKPLDEARLSFCSEHDSEENHMENEEDVRPS